MKSGYTKNFLRLCFTAAAVYVAFLIGKDTAEYNIFNNYFRRDDEEEDDSEEEKFYEKIAKELDDPDDCDESGNSI